MLELVGAHRVLCVDGAAVTQWGWGPCVPAPHPSARPCFPGLLSEVTDPENFLKDLLNSIP